MCSASWTPTVADSAAVQKHPEARLRSWDLFLHSLESIGPQRAHHRAPGGWSRDGSRTIVSHLSQLYVPMKCRRLALAFVLATLEIPIACSSSKEKGGGDASAGAAGVAGGSAGVSGQSGASGDPGGAGSTGAAGAGGTAGSSTGAAGAPPFDCSAASIAGPCDLPGLSCVLQGEAALPCSCIPGDGGAGWQCPDGLCPALGYGEPPACSSDVAGLIESFGGCKYPPDVVCGCEAVDGGEEWGCHEAAGATPDGSAEAGDGDTADGGGMETVGDAGLSAACSTQLLGAVCDAGPAAARAA
jgi:hypothetical protein